MNEPDDRELVNKFLESKEEKAFRQMYRRYTPRLYLFSLRLCAGNHHNAEDVVQETWIRVVQNLSKFLWRSAFSTWLSGIAFNCYREQRLLHEEAWQFPEEPAGREMELDGLLDMESLIRRLPGGCREVFVLHDIEGYTHEEIAKHLNVGIGTSKSQLFEARRKLRRWLTSTTLRKIQEESK